MLDEKAMEELLEAAKPSVIEGLKKELSNSITYDMKNKVVGEIGKYVEEWTKRELIPEIANHLIESKEGLISIGKALAPALVQEIVKAMTISLSENMKQSWTRGEVFKALFK
jgi:hypothetical protein